MPDIPPQHRRGDMPPPIDPVYSEADVALMRERWEQASREQSFASQLASLSGQLQSLPGQFENIAKKVFVEMASEQHREDRAASDNRYNRAVQISTVVQAIMAGAVVYLAVLRH